MSKAEHARFIVTTNMSDGLPHKVYAAYYSHEDRFTVFKTADGGIVGSFANDHLVSIQREVYMSDGSGSKN